MINTLKIKGFKCFLEDTFELNGITVLSGSNASGKSSLLQCILLIRSAIELSSHIDSKKGHYDLSNWIKNSIPLNDSYGLSLGIIDDILNSKYNNNVIEISFDNLSFKIKISENPDNFIHVDFEQNSEFKNFFLTQREFYYLTAERIGPRYFLDSKFVPFDNCGVRGEFTSDVISRKINSFFKVDKKRAIPGETNVNFQIQLDKWIDYIFPGTRVSTSKISNLQTQIRIQNEKNNVQSVATNIGFGISYALPIIVTGLIALEESVIIVENPEAHLHPKAQSNLGYFLFKVSSSNVKVIIETHSEHIINGIRRAAIEDNDNQNINIYFFNGFKEGRIKYDLIKVLGEGDLSAFPTDFYDQVRQDLLSIFQSITKKK